MHGLSLNLLEKCLLFIRKKVMNMNIKHNTVVIIKYKFLRPIKNVDYLF